MKIYVFANHHSLISSILYVFHPDCLSNRNTHTLLRRLHIKRSKHCRCHDKRLIFHYCPSRQCGKMTQGSIPDPLDFFILLLTLFFHFATISSGQVCPNNQIKMIRTVVNRTSYSSFFVPKREKGSGRNGKSKPHQSGAILSQR